MDFFLQQSFQTILQRTVWYFIFIIPRGANIDCPESSIDRSKEFWNKAKLFSAELDPETEPAAVTTAPTPAPAPHSPQAPTSASHRTQRAAKRARRREPPPHASGSGQAKVS